MSDGETSKRTFCQKCVCVGFFFFLEIVETIKDNKATKKLQFVCCFSCFLEIMMKEVGI
jgi:hypothetical protein